MSSTRVQDAVDQLAAASLQRWLFATGAIIAAGAASILASLDGGRVSPVATGIVVVLAAITTVQPSSQTGLLVIAAVFWQWVVMVDDETTAWTIGVAISLLVFHTTIALMAVTPHTATVARSVVLLWLRRIMIVAVGTIGVWLLAAAFEGWRSTGSTALTVTALVALTGCTIAVRILTLDRDA